MAGDALQLEPTGGHCAFADAVSALTMSYKRMLTGTLDARASACSSVSNAFRSGTVSSRSSSTWRWTSSTMKETERFHCVSVARALTRADGMASPTASRRRWGSPTCRKLIGPRRSAARRPFLQTSRQTTGATWIADLAKEDPVMSMPAALTSPTSTATLSPGKITRRLSTRPDDHAFTRTSLSTPNLTSPARSVSISSEASSGAYLPETMAATSSPRSRSVVAPESSFS